MPSAFTNTTRPSATNTARTLIKEQIDSYGMKVIEVQAALTDVDENGLALFTLGVGERILAYAVNVDTAVEVATATSLSVGSAADQDGVIDDTAVTSLDAENDTLGPAVPLAISDIASSATAILCYPTDGSSTPTDGFTAGVVTFRFWIEVFEAIGAA